MLACPVGIDTGKLIKGFREREHGRGAERVGAAAASAGPRRRAGGARRACGPAAAFAGRSATARCARPPAAARRVARLRAGPRVGRRRCRRRARRPPATRTRADAAAVYFPACINRVFGRSPGDARVEVVPVALVAVSERAGSPLRIPPDVAGSCCGTPGRPRGTRTATRGWRTTRSSSLWRWSDQGACRSSSTRARARMGSPQRGRPLL